VIVERIFISQEHSGFQVGHKRTAVQVRMRILGGVEFVKWNHPEQNITLGETEEIKLFCARFSSTVDLITTEGKFVGVTPEATK
jgi:hypothetical protein